MIARLTTRQDEVVERLRQYEDRHGWAVVGQEELAEYFGISIRAMRGLLKRLERAGAIDIKQRGRNMVNAYRILVGDHVPAPNPKTSLFKKIKRFLKKESPEGTVVRNRNTVPVRGLSAIPAATDWEFRRMLSWGNPPPRGCPA